MNPDVQNISITGRYSIPQAADMIGCSKRTMYRYVENFSWLLPVHRHVTGPMFLLGKDLIKFRASEFNDSRSRTA